MDNTSAINYQDSVRAQELRERKRQQNRVAQRTYRRNQKQKLQALQEAVNRSSKQDHTHGHIRSTSTSTSASVHQAGLATPEQQIWDMTVPDNLDGDLHMSSSLVSPQKEMLPSWDVVTPPEEFEITIGRNALHRAANNGNVAMCRLLLERGADKEKLDGSGMSVLHIAVQSGHMDMVSMLLDNGCTGIKDVKGRTALFQAVMSLDEAMVGRLLEAGIDINCTDYSGEVALHLAVEQNSQSITRLLLSRGANIDL